MSHNNIFAMDKTSAAIKSEMKVACNVYFKYRFKTGPLTEL